ncbi:MAG: ABC transporter substrate-binding protein, partial [Chloroflexota bacterium]|nr:ABC transporter substrate-binding protein [Chloroflexota bacterium]
NYSNYSNPKVDVLLDQANVEQDGAKRTELYRQAQQQILDDVAIIPIYHGTDYELVKPYVKGLSITAMGILRLETVWIER